MDEASASGTGDCDFKSHLFWRSSRLVLT